MQTEVSLCFASPDRIERCVNLGDSFSFREERLVLRIVYQQR